METNSRSKNMAKEDIVKSTPFSFGYTFLGYRTEQTVRAIPLWEKVLVETEFTRFIELGTARGGFSLFPMLFCQIHGKEFYTYDKRKMNIPKLIEPYFKRLDVFTDASVAEIGEIIQRPGRTILFCDNGRKEFEVKKYFPKLKKGDIIAVHDWITEVRPDSMPEGLEPIFEEECDFEELTRIFKKT